MEARIHARIAELEMAEKEAETRLIVILNLLIELRNLIAPERPIMSGDPIHGADIPDGDIDANPCKD